MEFTEQSRRTLQTLLQQHEHWLHESTRFITTYNDTATTDIDLDQTTSKYQYKNLIKAERALDEQLRALLCDLEQLLAPLLGPQSRAYMHILTLLGITSTTSTTNDTAGTSNSTTSSGGFGGKLSSSALEHSICRNSGKEVPADELIDTLVITTH